MTLPDMMNSTRRLDQCTPASPLPCAEDCNIRATLAVEMEVASKSEEVVVAVRDIVECKVNIDREVNERLNYGTTGYGNKPADANAGLLAVLIAGEEHADVCAMTVWTMQLTCLLMMPWIASYYVKLFTDCV